MFSLSFAGNFVRSSRNHFSKKDQNVAAKKHVAQVSPNRRKI